MRTETRTIYDDLKTICEAIEKGYEAELTMFDDDMVGHVQDLADSTKEILHLIEENEKLRRALGDIFEHYHKVDRVRQWAEEALLGNYT